MSAALLGLRILVAIAQTSKLAGVRTQTYELDKYF
jgi:hypothetical protein